MKRLFRGWIALVVAVCSLLLFNALRPAGIVASAEGAFLSERVGAGVWVAGAVLIVVCFVTAAEAFRHGRLGDRILAGIALLFGILLIAGYVNMMVLPVYRGP